MAFIYDAPLVTPLRGGLFTAATILQQDDKVRLFDGVLVRSFNCGPGFGLWSLECGASFQFEVQTVTLTGATSGTFTLTYDGETTDPIAFDASPAVVQAALSTLPNIGVGGVTVSGSPGNWTVTWNTTGDKPLMTIDTTGTDDGVGGDGVGEVTQLEAGDAGKSGDRVADTNFTGFGVWAADECGLKNQVEAARAARQKLKLHEQQLVEAEFAAVLLADAPAPVNPAAGEVEEFVRAVGELEALLGYLPGVIHADAHFAAWASHLGLRFDANGDPDNEGLYTPSGHRWAFSVGYSALGTTLIATGPVTVFRGALVEKEGLDQTHNQRLQIAEREYAVTYECGIYSRAVTATGGGGGGGGETCTSATVNPHIQRLTGDGSIVIPVGAKSVTVTVLTGDTSLQINGDAAVVIPAGVSLSWSVDSCSQTLADNFTVTNDAGGDDVIVNWTV